PIDMPPSRPSISSVKAMKTERTHEENQERAYIAASRRSDRSLEARIKSAGRASEIHRRRTGRSLRVTEQNVMNEEMYEEEYDDVSTQYLRMTAHLQNQNADLDRHFHSYLLNHVAMRQAVGDAPVDGIQIHRRFQPIAQSIQPDNMQMSQEQLAYPGSMMPPQIHNRTAPKYRQQLYPMPQSGVQQPTQSTQPSYDSRRRPLSVPTPWNVPQPQQPQLQPGQTSSVDTKAVDIRLVDPPLHTVLPIKPVSQQGQMPSPTHRFSAISRNHLVTDAATLHSHSKQSNSLHQMSSPLGMFSPFTQQQASPQLPQQASLRSPFGASFDQQVTAGMTPITMTLPMDYQHMIADSSSSNQSMSIMFSQQNYSYNPNGKPRNNGSQSLFDGPNQTLMAPPLETKIDGFDPNSSIASPQSSYSDSSYTKQFGYSNRGSDSGYGGDMLKRNFNGSGNITPQDVNFNSVFTFPKALQEDMLR
ncbi:hypothetical protein LTR91_020828, partial [Friedmanniomyces endolithicus]